MYVKPKKALGQHFLKDASIADRIAGALTGEGYQEVLEIGPGMGMLTQFLLKRDFDTFVVEIDQESIHYLEQHFPQLKGKIISGDFLREDIAALFQGPFAVAGNFPYNISSQIMFRVLEWKDRVPELVGMFQKEVAQRLVSGPGNKDYGILSVLLQAWYSGEYLFSVDEHVFDPPPKVKSGVIRFRRNGIKDLGCSEKTFKDVVKAAFNQRRKMLRNSMSQFHIPDDYPGWDAFSKLRPEQMSVQDFISLTKLLEASRK